MRVTVYSAQPYDRRFLDEVGATRFADAGIEWHYQPVALTRQTVALAAGSDAVCVFVNDALEAAVLEALAAQGVGAVVLRCAGFNNVDLVAARRLGLFVARVPAYSPEAVAEHALAMIMTLNRKTHRAYNRVREGNFALDGLLGVTLHGRPPGWSAAGASAWPWRVSCTGWAARCWVTIPPLRPPSRPTAKACRWRHCWRARTSSRCTVR